MQNSETIRIVEDISKFDMLYKMFVLFHNVDGLLYTTYINHHEWVVEHHLSW